MKSRVSHVAAALLFCLIVAGNSMATITISPGQSAALDPEDCASSQYYKGPLDNDWGMCLAGCDASCDLTAGTADAAFELLNTLGYKQVTSTIYGQFKIDDSLGTGAEVDGTINYDISWNGGWIMTGVFTNYNEAKAEVSVYLYDITNGSKVIKVTDPPVHTQTPDGFIGIDIFDAGGALDSGGTSNSMSAKLYRGHTYRAALTMKISAKGLANANITLDYFVGAFGLYWNSFEVTISPDLNERIAELETRVDTLEAQMTKLQSDLEHHTHTYLTGKGVGHNNTEAQTSEAIIMEDDNIPDSALTWNPDEPEGHTKGQRLPTKSVLTNYPNPFNPTTTILFTLPQPSEVTVDIYNNLGQRVATLLDGFREAGEYNVEWDAGSYASGVYYYRLTTPEYAETRKLLLLK